MALGKIPGRLLGEYVPDYVIFDLETTGLWPDADSIVEISGIRVRKGSPAEEFSTLVNPGRHIPRGASMINGITDEMVAGAPGEEEALRAFLDFAGEDVLAGHNIHSFDMKFIWRESEAFFGGVPGNDYVDTLYMARKALPQLKHHRLGDLASFYGISTEGAHRALADCRMNRLVYEQLGRELTQPGSTLAGKKICPQCGSFLCRRKGRYGEFWGCGSYPACRYTEKL